MLIVNYEEQEIEATPATAEALLMSPQLWEELVAKFIDRGVSSATLMVLVATIKSIALHIPGAYQATRLDEIDPIALFWKKL